jgi:hypothetical protein
VKTTMLYYLDGEGVTQGPVTPGAMLDLWRRGVVTDETPTALEGDVDWLPLMTFHDVLHPPKRVAQVVPAIGERRQKKRVHWAAQAGMVLTVVGLVTFALVSVVTGGIAAGLGLLMVIAFKN